jgi:hypothetical protein
MPILTDLHPSLEVAHVLRGQGIDPDRARPEIVAAARRALDEALPLLVPAAVQAVLPVRDRHRRTIVLEGGAVLEGSLVARALAGATEVALAVCTIGPALEARVSELFAAGDPVQALALDGAGVAALGGISRLVCERVCADAAARGLRMGMRASAGQEGWPLEQQRVIFGLLPADQIGVRLTESCLMLPRKSVSLAIGSGPKMRADATACNFCSKRERCNWRVW